METVRTGRDAGEGAARILVVEDEWLVALHVAQTLRGAGFEVVGPAARRAEAAALAAARRPALALVDVRLADGPTGPDVARDLAAAGVPCVFVSGNCPDGAEAGPALGCLHKPFSDAALLAVVRAALRWAAAAGPGDGADAAPPPLPAGFARFGRGDADRGRGAGPRSDTAPAAALAGGAWGGGGGAS